MPEKIDYLKNWVTLNKHIKELSEDELVKLLKKEQQGKNRFSFIYRIQGRINVLVVNRMRENLTRN